MEKNKIDFNKLEILSPAGNADCFFADLNAGADAIYLGLSDFNARMKAENFTTENIKNFVDKAHLMGVKVYVTLNTLLTDDDFDKLINLVKVLVEAKVDAYIIQDLGVAHILKNTFEDINLHASTQLGIHNLLGAKVAEKLGFTRIVLSREAKLEDIKQIHEHTNLEIEYFIQGALCVAFSGNCYLSSIEKQKSGNEGKCLQLCRLPYTNNLTNETTYNLSARDLSLLENLEDLINAGVTSFKIEGRLKHAGYCAVTTKIYKDAINKIKLNQFTKSWINEQYTYLRQTFSRGEFNRSAYLEASTPDKIIYKDYQNHIGVEIGKVLSVKPFKNDLYKVQIESSHPLNSSDGIKIIDKISKTQVCSLGIGNITKLNKNTYEFITKYKFSANHSVFLTQNSNFESEILSIKKNLDIDIYIEAFSNQNLKATILTNNQSYEYISQITLEKAKNSPLSKDDFYAQLNKLSDTDFKISNFELQTDGVFIPKSILNQFRRDLIEFITIQILNNYNLQNIKNVSINENQYLLIKNMEYKSKIQPKNIAIIDENFTELYNLNEFDIIVFKPHIFNFEIINKFYNSLGNLQNKFALNLPLIANYNDLNIINNVLNQLPSTISLYANNIYGLYYADKYNVITSPLFNTKNIFAIKCLLDFNIKTLSASVESSENFANDNKLSYFIKGQFPLMTFSHCPFKTIYDNTCKNCTYNENLVYSNQLLGSYKITRFKIFNCYFELNSHFLRKNSKFFTINFSKS